jgi:hypothetical protein
MQQNSVENYRKSLAADIFTCMELSRQSFVDVANMPIKKFYDYLKWKTDLEEEKQKRIDEETKKQSGKSFR